MRRVAAIAVLAAAVTAIATLGSGAGDSGSGYQVRAIFRNAFSVIPGEDVKIAGVKVGKISELEVTADQKAAVVLDITKPGFDDFRSDAECTIRPQSLIGEKYVECTPTQPRAEGAAAAPALKKIDDGDGKGQYLLPVQNTSKPVDIDLVNNILRLPYRQRLTILLNEFGAGLAGRGQDIKDVIRNADPALKETDKVLGILAGQNKVLAKLAEDSDTVLAPLARDRNKVADFVTQANKTAQATAERRQDLEGNFQRLPAFLRQLKPTVERLGDLSDQMTPVLSDLRTVSPDLSRLIRQLGPFSKASIPAFASLGDAADVGRPALINSRGIIGQVKDLTRTGAPLARDLNELLGSFKDTGGIDSLMDYIYFQVAAVNGFDANGHYLRAQLLVNLCSTYALELDPTCSARFSGDDAVAASAARFKSEKGRTPALARQDAVLRGMSLARAQKLYPDDDADPAGTPVSAKSRSATRKPAAGGQTPLALPDQVLPGTAGAGTGATGSAKSAGAATAQGSAGAAAAPAADKSTTDQSLLNYLLGDGS